MQSDPSYVSSMFNEISPTYDRVNRIVSFGQDLRWRKKLAEYAPLRPHLTLLDLATGTGDQLMALFQKGLSIQRAVGIDFAEEMLNLARKKLEGISYADRIQLVHANAEQLPLGDSQFDLVTCSFGIRNVANPLKALREARRVLKPGGRALILEFSLPPLWVRPFFLFYLRHALPWLGGVFSKKPQAYRYLNRTIETFLPKRLFLETMKEAGFSSVRAQSMNVGSVVLYTGEK